MKHTLTLRLDLCNISLNDRKITDRSGEFQISGEFKDIKDLKLNIITYNLQAKTFLFSSLHWGSRKPRALRVGSTTLPV